jgi:hypothetical protein
MGDSFLMPEMGCGGVERENCVLTDDHVRVATPTKNGCFVEVKLRWVPYLQKFSISEKLPYMRASTVQIRQRGTVTLPAKLCAKYCLGDGDTLTVFDLDGTILLSPKVPIVHKLSAEIERLRRAKGLSVEDLLTTSPIRRTKRGGARGRR